MTEEYRLFFIKLYLHREGTQYHANVKVYVESDQTHCSSVVMPIQYSEFADILKAFKQFVVNFGNCLKAINIGFDIKIETVKFNKVTNKWVTVPPVFAYPIDEERFEALINSSEKETHITIDLRRESADSNEENKKK